MVVIALANSPLGLWFSVKLNLFEDFWAANIICQPSFITHKGFWLTYFTLGHHEWPLKNGCKWKIEVTTIQNYKLK